ncbi:MAG TPA: uroporphyrinogen decarboxylase [Polyangiaceae bacterium]|jgi:uroporphyrinogen decarboxylase|nr:uroporphyrinogen decarboxylase [Polyangiaceae bacterium]
MWDRFLRACRREPVDCTPVWFMRQAGRYMPEYRAIRAKYSLLEICARPEVACEVTLQPVIAHKVDAAILFADILLPLEPMGAPFEFAAGEGPVFESPVRTRADIERLRVIDAEESLPHVLRAITLIRSELEGKTPLIGFAGAPFTLASYLVEGGKSDNYVKTKELMYREPELWGLLMQKLAQVVGRYLRAQVRAGAQALQVFDSWVGDLSPTDYVEFIQPYYRPLFAELATLGVPVIHFGTGTGNLLELQRDTGGSVIGVDFRTPLDVARKRLGNGVAIQGNLDPLVLNAPRDFIKRRVRDVLDRAGDQPGHIFNLGHGVLPHIPPENVTYVRELVHELSARV